MDKLSCAVFLGFVCFSASTTFCGKHDREKGKGPKRHVSFDDYLKFVREDRVKAVEDYFAAFPGSPRPAHAAGEHGMTALHFAQTERMANLLLLHGADARATDDHGRTPLHYAAHNVVARVLLNAQADVHRRDVEGRTALFYARTAGIVEQLVARGVTVNDHDVQGNRPIHLATNADVLRALIAAGADVNAVNNAGQTSFEYMTEQIHQVAVQIQQPPERAQAEDIYNEMLLVLLQHNALMAHDQTQPVFEGAMLEVVHDEFVAACIAGDVTRAQELLAADEQTQMQDSQTGEVLLPRAERPAHDITPLMAAVAQGHTDVVNALLAAGARATVQHVRVAQRNGFTDLANMLREHLVGNVVVPHIQVTPANATQALGTPSPVETDGFMLVHQRPVPDAQTHNGAQGAAFACVETYFGGCASGLRS